MRRIKAKITTQLEQDLKEMFELMECVHHHSYQEALERGVREILIETNQPQFLDQEILRNQAEITKLTQRQMLFETAKEKLKNIKIEIFENKNNGQSEGLENMRDRLYNNSFGSEKQRENNKTIQKRQWEENQGMRWNWDRIIENYQFKDKKEAMEWFRNRIEVENDNYKNR